jgi:hypothetical protein
MSYDININLIGTALLSVYLDAAFMNNSKREEREMVGRIWHGWTTFANADVYENLLKTEIFPGIAQKGVAGYRSIQLFRRPCDEEVEFITIMWFDSWDSVKQFAGEDYETAYVPQKAREVLSRFDERSQHYEIREQIFC